MGTLLRRMTHRTQADVDPSVHEPSLFAACWRPLTRSAVESGGRLIHRAVWPGHALHRQPLRLGQAEAANVAAVWHGRCFVISVDRVRTFDWNAWNLLFARPLDLSVRQAVLAAASRYGISPPIVPAGLDRQAVHSVG